MKVAILLGLLLVAVPLRADPVITSLAPNSAPRTGGTVVVVAGTGFLPDDAVVFAGPNIVSEPGDSCDDGFPLCENNQCQLSEARGTCTINGVAGLDPFIYVGPDEIRVITPSVGYSGRGPADVMVVAATGPTSNVMTFLFTPAQEDLPPIIHSTFPTEIAGPDCCPQGWMLSLFGMRFRRCGSIVVAGSGGVHELLPTPDLDDCADPRGGSGETPRDRLRRLLPPDGGTIACDQRPDLVPLRPVASPIYRHDLICAGPVPAPFCPDDARMLPNGSNPNDVTVGGAFTWISSSQVRINFMPAVMPACDSSEIVTIYVQNEPGRGISGDLLSNSVSLELTNTTPCSCAVEAIASALTPVCPGSVVTIDASSSQGQFCAAGLEYEFAQDPLIPCPFGFPDFCAVTVNSTSTYRVRVRCAGDHACIDETEVTIEVDPDPLPPDQGNVLRTVRDGADVRLDFASAPASAWRVFADSDHELLNLQPLPPDADLPEYRDLGAIAGGDRYYQIRGLSTCSRTPGP